MDTHQVTISGITGQWTDSGHVNLLRLTKTGKTKLLGDLSFEE